MPRSIKYLLYNNEELNSTPQYPLKMSYVVAHGYNLVVQGVGGAETGESQELTGQPA